MKTKTKKDLSYVFMGGLIAATALAAIQLITPSNTATASSSEETPGKLPIPGQLGAAPITGTEVMNWNINREITLTIGELQDIVDELTIDYGAVENPNVIRVDHRDVADYTQMLIEIGYFRGQQDAVEGVTNVVYNPFEKRYTWAKENGPWGVLGRILDPGEVMDTSIVSLEQEIQSGVFMLAPPE